MLKLIADKSELRTAAEKTTPFLGYLKHLEARLMANSGEA